MKRIATATVVEDLHGTGLDGFTDGVAPTTSETHLNAEWFNHVQEEIANAVSNSGQDVVTDGTLNYWQLDRAIQSMSQTSCANARTGYVLFGAIFDAAVGLDYQLDTTVDTSFVHEGRRYYFTSGEMDDQGWDVLTLVATRDNYIFIAPGDGSTTGAWASPPRSDVVEIQQSDVAVGAAAPSTPSGFILVARVQTDATDVVETEYFNRGPRIEGEDQSGFQLLPAEGNRSHAALVPVRPDSLTEVHIGENGTPSNIDGRPDYIYTKALDIRGAGNTDYAPMWNRRYTGIEVTFAGGQATEAIADISADVLPNNCVLGIWVKGVAYSAADDTDGFTFDLRGHAHNDSGWDLDGDQETWTGGAGAEAAGCSVGLQISGDQVQIRFTGHSTDEMNWFYEVHVMLIGES